MEPLKKQVRYVSFNSRVMASVIDTVLSLLVLTPLFRLIALLIYGPNTPARQMQVLFWESAKDKTMLSDALGAFQQALMTQPGDFWLHVVSDSLMQIVICVIILWLFWRYRAATPGKMLLNMRIADAETFEKPTRKQWVLRLLGYIVSALPLCLGFFWAAFDKRHQAWHDKIAGTVVIKK